MGIIINIMGGHKPLAANNGISQINQNHQFQPLYDVNQSA